MIVSAESAGKDQGIDGRGESSPKGQGDGVHGTPYAWQSMSVFMFPFALQRRNILFF